MKSIRVAGASLNQTPLDWVGNRQRILEAIAQAKADRISLLCLPELAITGYGCEDAFFADTTTANALATLKAILPATGGLVVFVGMPLQYENALYNVVACIEDGRLLGLVAKQALAGDGIHYEPRWFKPWPDHTRGTFTFEGQTVPIGDLIFEIDGLRIGLEICEDAWTGIRPAQQHYRHNVDLILNPSASHFAFGKSEVRNSLVRETSRSYLCSYIYSNLCGNEAGRVIYDGEVLVAQAGTILARNRRFSFADVQLVPAVIDPSVARRMKKKLFAFLPEAPTHLIHGQFVWPADVEQNVLDPKADIPAIAPKEEEFFRAECLALFDYLRKSYSRGFVISLSGGADSCACAVLAAYCLRLAYEDLGEAAFRQKLHYLTLGPIDTMARQLITCVYQGTEHSGPETRLSAEALAHALGVTYFYWTVDHVLSGYHALIEGALGRKLAWETDDLALQNIQARTRAPGVWFLANLQGALLLTTSNRSEAAVGYATMDGDTAGGLAPLGGIDKATLRSWLHWAQAALSLPALAHVNALAPTAELRPQTYNQTDEGDLMPYPVLDQIERCAIHQYKSPLATFKYLRGTAPDRVLADWVKKFYRLWARNQWKRERYAPSFHLDDANLDPRTWCRFPILSAGYEEELAELEAFVG